MRHVLLPIFVASLAVGLDARAETPLRGDAEAGRSLFSLECGACHGSHGKGNPGWKAAQAGKPLPDLVDTAFLVTRTDPELHAAMATGHTPDGRWIPGHVFSSLSELDRWNVVQWLRDQSLAVEDFFPQAVKFTAKEFEIDAMGAGRLAELGVGKDELGVVVLTAYKGTRKPNEPLRLVPWTPVELDLLEAGDRLGHLSFIDIEAPNGEMLHTGIAFDTDGKIVAIRVRHADPAKRASYERALGHFVGQTLKVATKLSAPRGLAQGAAWANALSRAASRAAEAILMYEKGERARTVFDL